MTTAQDGGLAVHVFRSRRSRRRKVVCIYIGGRFLHLNATQAYRLADLMVDALEADENAQNAPASTTAR